MLTTFLQDSPLPNAYEDPNGLSPHSDFTANVNPQYLDASHANTSQGLQDFYTQPTTTQPQPEDSGLFKDMQNLNTYQGHSYNNSLSQPFDHSQNPGSHSRGQSLSPSSAAVPPGQAAREWGGIAFQGHRRHPSADAYSDLSSHHSPFVDAVESFDALGRTSPNLTSQPDPSLVSDSLGGLGDFSISDPNIIHSHHASPGHSAHVSPHLSPQSGMTFDGSDQFNMLAADPGPQMFENAGPGMEEFPANMQFNAGGPEGGATNDMETPQINIEFAPQRQLTFNEPGAKNEDGADALSPPSRSPSRQRGRAISDPYSSANHSRSSTPGRQRAPSLGLHPGAAGSRSSRSPSPSGPPNGIQKPRDRASSTSSIPAQRDYMLGLADPERQQSLSSNSSVSGLPSNGENGGGRGRGQKHPATFQCSLCPKRFTRAYNLRSHLRTHTDERPFVCTVCGKAFARQHDRKRHEALHSGEKKFVCKGNLSSGSSWGCGRRFARADALGRHFRSEAGRTCIKPLLEEEARERRAAMMEQANQEAMQQQQTGMQPQPGQMGYAANPAPVDMSGMTLPAALLAQYPALAGIQWDALPPAGSGGLDVDDGDFDDFGASGRSSYDASSGGELDFEDDGSFDPNIMANSQGWVQPGVAQQHMGQAAQAGQQGHWNGGFQGR